MPGGGADLLPAATCEWFRQRAVQGFSSPQWAAIVEAHRELFTPAIYADLWAMRDRVLASARAEAAPLGAGPSTTIDPAASAPTCPRANVAGILPPGARPSLSAEAS